jgi:hypothetical protein
VLLIGLMGSTQASLGAQEMGVGSGVAAEVEAAAAALHDRADQWAEAAVLYTTAAGLRPDGDPQVQRDLLLAANLSQTIGDLDGAQRILETAGDRALADDDGELAAEMYAAAAAVAGRAGRAIEQRRLSRRVESLTLGMDPGR